MIDIKYNEKTDFVHVEFFSEKDGKNAETVLLTNAILNTNYQFEFQEFGDYYLLMLNQGDLVSLIKHNSTFENFALLNNNKRSYEIQATCQEILKSDLYSNFAQHLVIRGFGFESENPDITGCIGLNLEISLAEDYNHWSLYITIKKVIDSLEKCSAFDDKISIDVDQPDSKDKSLFFLMVEMRFEGKKNIAVALTSFIERLKILEEQVYRDFDPIKWDEKYLKDEKSFTLEVVLPLFRRLSFDSVKYTHGSMEYGRDLVCSYTDAIGQKRFIAVQIKAGNLSGRANSQIDEILSQLDDAMSIPYQDITNPVVIYMCQFYIIISGKFTNNAQHKILSKLPNHKKGQVTFIDQAKILDLLKAHW